MAINVKDKLVTLESLGVAYSAEQDAREEADQALSTRIDNIVAPEGDPSLTEVSDARVSGSTTHNTLKARLDADKSAIETEISQLSADLGDLDNLETETKTDLVSAINEAAQSGLSNDVKNAILAAFDKVAWSDGRGQDYYDGLEAALYPNISHDVHGWFYEFNNSLLSSGDKDFGFTGSEFYDPSGVNGKAYYHKVATEGTASTDPLGIYKIGLSDVPDLSGDFTISFWHKSITNKRGYLFRATKFDSLNRVPIIKGTMDNPYWSDNVSASADVAGSFKGVRLSYDGNNGYLYIGLSSLTQDKTIYAALIMPNSIDTRSWHHHAITRSNGVIRYFFDGGLIWHVENSDPIAFPNQVCLGNTFGTTQATATNVVQDKHGGMFDDLYIVQFAKWTSAFDPTNIVY